MSDNIENKFKELFEDYSAPYSENDWAEFNQKLNGSSSNFWNSNLFRGLAVASVVAVTALSLNYYNSHKEEINNPIVEGITDDPIENTKLIADDVPQTFEVEVTKPELVEESETIENLKVIDQPKEIEPQIAIKHNAPKESKEKLDFTPVKTISVIASKSKLCESEVASFKLNDTLKNHTYSWNFGDGKTSNQFRPKHIFKKSGNYKVAVTAINNATKQKYRYTIVSDIVVYNKPKADFEWEKSDFHCHNSSICFKTNVNEATAYKWNFGDEKISKEPNPKHNFIRKGRYSVKHVAKNEFGCADSVMKLVRVIKAYNLLAAPSFNPETESWIPTALTMKKYDFNLIVKNENGENVFTSTDSKKVWNGATPDGKVAQKDEVFIWIAVVKDSTGSIQEYGGSIIIN